MRTPDLRNIAAPIVMKTAGTSQWPWRSIASMMRRWEPSHEAANHHRATPAVNTAMVRAVGVAREATASGPARDQGGGPRRSQRLPAMSRKTATRP